MYKAIANTTLFAVLYLIFILPSYYFNLASSINSALTDKALSLPFVLYLLSMLVLCGICLMRGAMIGKYWLVLIPAVAFVFNLTPVLNEIPLVPYVYHLLAIIIGSACPLVSMSAPDTVMRLD
ncbi:MAG TPA: hypothetical protein VGD04_10630 [Methylophilus sp.]